MQKSNINGINWLGLFYADNLICPIELSSAYFVFV